jgi:putative ABC transport system permease protein
VATVNELLMRSMAEARFHLMLLVSLAAVGLLLAAAGIYSVIAYFVTLRTHEIGVRMALGATPRDVVRLLTWSGLRPVLGGAVLGWLLATWATRLLRGSLYGVEATDPTTFVLVISVLLVVALAAILVPARRATRVDPSRVLGAT